jgi:hypothetical protein
VQYVTLSHLWGSGVPLKLLRDNFEELRSRIPLESMSQTFRDAILVTRKFGFRYVWIDSLCIIQDCDDDWRKESALMRSVYKGGICNIAATAASNGANGLFSTRDPFTISPFTIDIARKDFEQSYLCFRGEARYEGFIKAPLNRRGWVYQERLLSPRTIHFSSQLFWECKELEASETYPMGLDDPREVEDQDQKRDNRWAFSLMEKSWLDDILLEPRSRYQVWERIVSEYTCCALT